MAVTYYAVATGNFSATTVWSLSSGGVVTPAAPGSADTAVFDSNTGAHTVTLTGATSIATLTMTGSTGTLAFGTQTLTVSAGATLAGALTSTSGTLVVSGSGVTLAGTPTGSFPAIKLTTAAQTFTFAGFTWPGALNLDYAGTITFSNSGNACPISGLLTFTLATNAVANTTETLTVAGGLTTTVTTGASSTIPITLTGGTWTGGTKYLYNPVTFAGNVTLASASFIGFAGTSITYSSGTITTTNSNLEIGTNITLNTAGMSWGNITVNPSFGVSPTFTLSSALTMNGVLELMMNQNTVTFAGAYNITCATLNIINTTSTSSIVLVASQTLNVTTSIYSLGVVNLTGAVYTTVQSATTSSNTNINYTGAQNKQILGGMAFTDVDATGSTLYNYGGGTLTRTTNIVNVTAANIGNGFFIQ